MPKRYFNWKLAVVLLIGMAVLVATAFGLRQWQKSNRVERGLRLGSKAYAEHRWEEAASQLGSYLSVSHDNIPILLKYADAVRNIRPVKSHNIEQAIAAYRSILRVDPNNSDTAKRLTELYLVIGAPGEAELISKRYLEKNQDLELRRLLAMAMARQRKFDEAASELKIIIAKNPEQILAYELLGQLIEQRPENFSEKPDRWFDEAVKNNPSSALAYIVRASFRLRSNDRTKALADLEIAEKLDISDSIVQLRLGQEFANANSFEKAEEYLAAVQKMDPTNPALWATWAQLGFKSQSQGKRVNIAETGLRELAAQPWDFMPLAAELFIQAGQFDRATDCLTQLRQKDITPPVTAFLEGLLADRKGEGYEAIRCWRRAMELGNKYPQIRLMLASTLAKLGDTQSALRQLRTFVSEQPELFDGQLALARLASQTENLAEAAEHAEKAVQLAPANTDAVLLSLQTKVQLLRARSKDQSTAKKADVELNDHELDNQLALLVKATNGALKVRLLQFTLMQQRGDFAAAQTLLSELSKTYPSEIEVAMAQVNLLTAQGRTDETIAALTKTIKEFPGAIMPVQYLLALYVRQGNYERCEAVINDALKRFEQPEDQRSLGLMLADVYAMWKKEDKAYTTLSSLDQRLPAGITVKRRLLQCSQIMKNNAQSQQLVNDIQLLEGQEGWQWRFEQARLWLREEADSGERRPQIINILKENLLANPDDQASRLLLAVTYEQDRELQLAISTYREALTRSPHDIRIIVSLVEALYKVNDYDHADEILHQAADEALVNPELKTLELQSYLKRGEIGSAATVLEGLFSNDPNNQSICLSLALLKMRQNKLAEAGELLTSLKIHDPNSLLISMAQIELNIRQGKSVEALALCDQVVSRQKNAAAYMLQGRAYVLLGHNEEAMKSMEKATLMEPNNSSTWAAKSSFYSYLGRTDKAEDDIEKALSLEPNNVQIQKTAILLFLRSGSSDRVHRANELIEKGLQANPLDGELRLLKARLLLAKQTAPAIEQAKNIIQAVTKDQPEVVDAWLLLGELALRQGNTSEALDIVLHGLIRQPNNKALLMLQARVQLERTPSLAIATLKTLHDSDSNDAATAILLSNAYSMAGEPAKAVSVLETQVSAHPKADADAKIIQIALAVASYKNGDEAKSQAIFSSLYQANPNDPNVLLGEVRLLKSGKLWSRITDKVNQWHESHKQDVSTLTTIAQELAAVNDNEARKTAEDILRKVLANNSEYVEALNTLGILLQSGGHSAEAQILYERVLKLQPENMVVLNNMAWILCEDQGKYQQALELTQRGLKIAPDYVDLIDTRGVAYYRLGELDKAVRDFRRCTELYPARMPAATASCFHLGRALAKLGQKDEAQSSLKKAIELNADIAGLSPTDLAEARQLLEKLSQPSDKEGGSMSSLQSNAK